MKTILVRDAVIRIIYDDAHGIAWLDLQHEGQVMDISCQIDSPPMYVAQHGWEMFRHEIGSDAKFLKISEKEMIGKNYIRKIELISEPEREEKR